LPELEQVRRKYEARGVGFVALSLERSEEAVRAGARALQLQMPLAVADGEVLAPLGVNQVPSVVFINARGIIVAAANGEQGRGFLERRVRMLLTPGAP
jgi:hypothetical protein